MRKLWYDTSNAFQRENVVGYFKQLCDSLNSRCMLLTVRAIHSLALESATADRSHASQLMLVQSQHDCIVLERYK